MWREHRYNVQFYNQGSTTYTTYATLFRTSAGWASGTAVNELIRDVGIPASMVVVGKPVAASDATSGCVEQA